MQIFEWVAQSPTVHFSLIVGIGSIFAAIALILFWRHYAYYRLIHNTPTSRLRSASQGYVELQGVAQSLAESPVLSPLSGFPCVWWSYTIEHRVHYEGRYSWRKVETAQSNELFQLVDGEHQCVINPTAAIVITDNSDTWTGITRKPLPRAVKVGEDWRFPMERSIQPPTYRYTEKLLHDGEILHVLGDLTTRRPAEDFDADAELRNTLVRWKQNQSSLLKRFDSDRSGYIDQQEWQAARAAAQIEVDKKLIQLRTLPARNMLTAPKDSRPLLLSDRDPEGTASKHLKLAQLYLSLFLILAAAITWLLVNRA